MILLAVDPGENFGTASFVNGSLSAAGFRRLPELRPDLLVIEKPEIYPRSPVPPNDVITLAIAAGRIAARANALDEVWILPKQWKGQVPKHIIAQRVWDALDDGERRRLDFALASVATGQRNNVVDAIGIGLWYLKRLPR